MDQNLMQTLGAFLGEKFAKITLLFAQKGEVSAEYDTLKKVEDKIKNVSSSVINAILKTDIISNLTSADNTKVLAASQGKALKDSITDLSTTLAGKADSTTVLTKAEIGATADFTTAFNTAAGNLFNS